MHYVYLLQSIVEPERFYVGTSDDPTHRLDEHNGGNLIHTNKHEPWKIVVTIGLADPAKAMALERYSKSGSGRTFAEKHF